MRRSAPAYAHWAGLGDPVLEINLTPNRQDCTGVHGIARDLAAADMGKFKDPGDQADQGRIPLPGEGDCRGRHAVSGLCACGWCAASRTARRRNGCKSA